MVGFVWGKICAVGFFLATVPVFHFLITDGFLRLMNEGGFYWLIGMAFLYLFGAMIYATRTPERFCPGKFDLWVGLIVFKRDDQVFIINRKNYYRLGIPVNVKFF